MPLQLLPEELQLMVGESLASARDINAFLQTNRLAYCQLARHLYLDNARHDASSALFWAARAGQLHTAQRAMAADADIGCKGDGSCGRFTPLMAAAASPGTNSVGFARLMIENGAHVDCKDEHGRSPLLVAITARNTEDMARFLIAHGADVNRANDDGTTPLMAAVTHHSAAMAQLLIDHGANFNDSTANDLLLTAASGTHCPTVITFLLDHGAAINHADTDGCTALHQATHSDEPSSTTTLAQLLATEHVGPNSQDACGQTPLFIAAHRGLTDKARLLLDSGADANIPDADGCTPLSEAVACADDDDVVEISRLLLDRGGAAVDVEDDQRQSPLFKAAMRGDAAVVRLLLAYGGVKSMGAEGEVAPLRAAEIAGDEGCVALLREAAAWMRPAGMAKRKVEEM